MNTSIKNKSLEKILVNHVYNCSFEDFPQEVIDYCKLLLLDSLGVCFPGSNAPGCYEAASLLSSWNAPTNSCASLLVYTGKLNPPQAALINSMIMHALDFDDTLDDSALHCFVNVLPSALASAQQQNSVSGKKLIESLVLGTDVLCRISRAIPSPLSWIRTATCGSFGSAAAAGKIVCTNKEELHNALGIVYAQTSGNAQGLIEGRLIKRMQPGFAAHAGVMSAFLARSGITGSKSFLEGEYGYFNLYERSEYNAEEVAAGLGEHFQITDLSIKPYPCCRMTHSAIDAALDLRNSIISQLDAIDSIKVYASRMVKDMVGSPFSIGENPQVSAQFSIPYTVSTALLYGDVFLQSFEDEAIRDSVVGRLAQKVEVVEDSLLEPKDIYRVKMQILLQDGGSYEKRINVPLGNPRAALSLDQIKEKFQKCVEYSGIEFSRENMEHLFDLIENLEDLSDVSALTDLVSNRKKLRTD
ncbi:MAG: MmgE/PrpD family protein [Bacteroidales bacterium]